MRWEILYEQERVLVFFRYFVRMSMYYISWRTCWEWFENFFFLCHYSQSTLPLWLHYIKHNFSIMVTVVVLIYIMIVTIEIAIYQVMTPFLFLCHDQQHWLVWGVKTTTKAENYGTPCRQKLRVGCTSTYVWCVCQNMCGVSLLLCGVSLLLCVCQILCGVSPLLCGVLLLLCGVSLLLFVC